MFYKKLTQPKHYGSTNNTCEHLTEMSCNEEEEDELELKKSKTLVIMRCLDGTICLVMVSCELLTLLYADILLDQWLLM